MTNKEKLNKFIIKKDYKSIYQIKKMLDIINESNSFIYSNKKMFKYFKYLKFKDINKDYYYYNLLNEKQQIEYLEYLINIDFEEFKNFIHEISLTIKIQKHIYDIISVETITHNEFDLFFTVKTYNDFVELYKYFDDDSRQKLLKYHSPYLVIDDCNNVDFKYMDLILGNIILNKELIYRYYYYCKKIIKHYITIDEMLNLFKSINNLYFSDYILEIINDDNQFIFMSYFLKHNDYSYILKKINYIDETQTKYYNHIMDVLNCKDSEILVEILDKTKLSIKEKQDILLLKTRKSCKI